MKRKKQFSMSGRSKLFIALGIHLFLIMLTAFMVDMPASEANERAWMLVEYIVLFCVHIMACHIVFIQYHRRALKFRDFKGFMEQIRAYGTYQSTSISFGLTFAILIYRLLDMFSVMSVSQYNWLGFEAADFEIAFGTIPLWVGIVVYMLGVPSWFYFEYKAQRGY